MAVFKKRRPSKGIRLEPLERVKPSTAPKTTRKKIGIDIFRERARKVSPEKLQSEYARLLDRISREEGDPQKSQGAKSMFEQVAKHRRISLDPMGTSIPVLREGVETNKPVQEPAKEEEEITKQLQAPESKTTRRGFLGTALKLAAGGTLIYMGGRPLYRALTRKNPNKTRIKELTSQGVTHPQWWLENGDRFTLDHMKRVSEVCKNAGTIAGRDVPPAEVLGALEVAKGAPNPAAAYQRMLQQGVDRKLADHLISGNGNALKYISPVSQAL